MASRIRLDLREYRKCMALKGVTTDAAAAKLIGVDAATLSRVLKGNAAPGERFIAGLLLALPEVSFEDLFTVEADDESEAVPA